MQGVEPLLLLLELVAVLLGIDREIVTNFLDRLNLHEVVARARQREVIGDDDGVLLDLDVASQPLLDFGNERLEKLDATRGGFRQR